MYSLNVCKLYTLNRNIPNKQTQLQYKLPKELMSSIITHNEYNNLEIKLQQT